jgi:hypothetical protein
MRQMPAFHAVRVIVSTAAPHLTPRVSSSSTVAERTSATTSEAGRTAKNM